MTEKADLVVIAIPTARREANEPTTLPNWTSCGRPIPAVEIETTFRTAVAFKSTTTAQDTSFALIHHRRLDPLPEIYVGPLPMLVDFQPHDGSQFLMFLKRRTDGRYEGVNSSDPGHCIEKLRLGL